MDRVFNSLMQCAILLRCRRAATAVEYALLISLLSISGWSAFNWVGSKIAGSMNNAAAAMPGSIPTPDDDDDDD